MGKSNPPSIERVAELSSMAKCESVEGGIWLEGPRMIGVLKSQIQLVQLQTGGLAMSCEEILRQKIR